MRRNDRARNKSIAGLVVHNDEEKINDTIAFNSLNSYTEGDKGIAQGKEV